MFNIETKNNCPLPDLLGGKRYEHSQCGRLLCGGHGDYFTSAERSCLMFNPLTGNFTPASVSLGEERVDHLCWDVEGENGPTLLIGGSYSNRSTELVSHDGSSSSASFNLTYGT